MSARDDRRKRGRPAIEVTLPEHVLVALDMMARGAGVSRSAMVAQLIREQVARAFA